MLLIEIEEIINNTIKGIEKTFAKLEYNDDYCFCFQCGYYHYPDNHLKGKPY